MRKVVTHYALTVGKFRFSPEMLETTSVSLLNSSARSHVLPPWSQQMNSSVFFLLTDDRNSARSGDVSLKTVGRVFR